MGERKRTSKERARSVEKEGKERPGVQGTERDGRHRHSGTCSQETQSYNAGACRAWTDFGAYVTSSKYTFVTLGAVSLQNGPATEGSFRMCCQVLSSKLFSAGQTLLHAAPTS